MRLISWSILFFSFINLLSAQKIEVYSTNMNSIRDDYSPTFYEKGLIITSNRKNNSLKNYFEKGAKKENNYLNDLYYYLMDDDSTKLKLIKNTFPLNTPNSHEGPCTFSQKYDTIYFVKNINHSNKKGKLTLGIFYCIKKNGVWNEPTLVNFHNDQYNFSHPNISPDGTHLYFVSDLPNGIGGKDIWYSNKVDNNWSEPINAGPSINTVNDETFPFLSSENILYFSSNRVKNKGFDIYRKNSLHSSPAVLLSAPINSNADDYGFITADNEKSGYFSSNRTKKIDDDIYFFKRDLKFGNCEKAITPKFCYTFYDSEHDKKEPHVKYVWNFENEGVSHDSEPYHCFKTYGNHKIKLSMIDTITGVVSQNVSTYNLNIHQNVSYFFSQDHIKPNELITVKVLDINSDTVSEQSISWSLEDQYFFEQDSLDIYKNIPGEYKLTSKIDDESGSCIKSDLIIDNEEYSSLQTYKILPRKIEENPLSDFIKNKIDDSIFNNELSLKYTLKIPQALEKQNSIWANSFKNNLLNKYKIDTEIEYLSSTEMNYIYLSISNK